MTERTVENLSRALFRVIRLAERLSILAQEQHPEQAGVVMQEAFNIGFEFVDHDAILAEMAANDLAREELEREFWLNEMADEQARGQA